MKLMKSERYITKFIAILFLIQSCNFFSLTPVPVTEIKLVLTDTPSTLPTSQSTQSSDNTPVAPPTFPPTPLPADMPIALPTFPPTPLPTDTPIALPTFPPTPLRADTPIALPTFPPTPLPADTPIAPPTPTTVGLPPIASGNVFLPNDQSNPEGFVRWYFKRVTTERDYKNIWEYMTDRFKKKGTPGGINDYISWWDSVRSVEVNRISFEGQINSLQHYLVSLTFYMKNDKVISGEYDYYLVFNNSLGYWQFDRP